MEKPVRKNPEETQEIQEHPDTLKLGTEFTLMGNRVKVHQIDLPRLTLSLTHKKLQFNPELRGQQLKFGGHDFLVKSATGSRLYLLLLEEITEKEVLKKQVECCSSCGNTHEGMLFNQLADPEEIKGMICTHSAKCPETGIDVYLTKAVSEKDDDELCKDCKHVADGKCDGKWFAGCNDFEKEGEQNESL